MRYGEKDLVYKPSGVYQKSKYVPSGVYQRQFPKFQIGHTQQLDVTVPIPKSAPIPGQVPPNSSITLKGNLETYLGDYQGIEFIPLTVAPGFSGSRFIATVPVGQVWHVISVLAYFTMSSAVANRLVALQYTTPGNTSPAASLGFFWQSGYIGPMTANQVVLINGIIGYPSPIDITSSNTNGINTIVPPVFHSWLPDTYLEQEYNIYTPVQGSQAGDIAGSTNTGQFSFIAAQVWKQAI